MQLSSDNIGNVNRNVVGNLKFIQMLVQLKSCGFSLWILFQSSGCLFVLNGQVTLNCISLHQKKCRRILLLPAMTNILSPFKNVFKILRICILAWQRNIKKVAKEI